MELKYLYEAEIHNEVITEQELQEISEFYMGSTNDIPKSLIKLLEHLKQNNAYLMFIKDAPSNQKIATDSAFMAAYSDPFVTAERKHQYIGEYHTYLHYIRFFIKTRYLQMV